jgi:endonuclease/exonuclease/phosphatase family metal-dependent hydrolase
VRLRLLTYNIHKCIGGLDRRYRPERTVEAIGHYAPDVVLLQEVDAGARRSNYDRQVDRLGEALGLRHRIWFPNVSLRDGGAYGNAILSRFPIHHAHNHDLTVGTRKRRSVLHARIRVRVPHSSRVRTVHVFNMHLGLLEADRRRQLVRFLDSHPFVNMHARTPVMVAGDFNDLYGSLGGRLLLPAGFRGMRTPVRTFPAYAPLRALDTVFVRGDLQIRRAMPGRTDVARRASDHLPLVCDLELATS